MSSSSSVYPLFVARLFWDVDPATVELERHRNYVIERVMARGCWAAMCWLRESYSVEVLAEFVRCRGTRLAPREEAYWALITGVESGPRRGGGQPPWVNRCP